MTEKDLIGKVIKDIKIATDRMALLLILDKEEIIARTDGDCCSQSWIEHIDVPNLPATILSITDIMMDEIIPEDGLDDTIKIYCTKISTTTGDIEIEYRNSSNGYYGGSISFGDGSFNAGGGQNVSTLEWIDIENR